MTAALSVLPFAARQLFICRDHDSLVNALLARKADLGLSDAWVDQNALSPGYMEKLSSRERNLGKISLDGLMIVLGLQIALLEDPARVKLMRNAWEQGDSAKIHPARSTAAAAAIERAAAPPARVRRAGPEARGAWVGGAAGGARTRR